MKRLLVNLAIIVALLFPLVADASKGWCRSDPIIETGGRYIAIMGSAETQIQSATYEITSPDPITVRYETHGMAVNENTVKLVGSTLKIRLITDNDENTPIQLIVAERDGQTRVLYGFANTTITYYP